MMSQPHPVRSHFFNAVWLYGAGALAIAGMITQQTAITLLAAAVFVTASGSWAWTRYALRGIAYQRELSETRLFPGDILTVTFHLENRSWLPLAWIEIEEHMSDRIRPLDKTIRPSDRVGTALIRHTTPLRWKQRLTWTVELECQERGSHFVGPVKLRSGDPFGFFTNEFALEHRDRFLVYPEIVQLPNFGFPADYPFGGQRVPQNLLTDPARVIGVRDYAPDDTVRHIHWKASARLEKLQVKIFEPVVSQRLGIFLSLDTFERYWEGMDSVRAESAIAVAASLVSHSLERRSLVGLYANGVVADSDQTLRIPPGRGPQQLERMLEGLARLSPLATTNYPKLLLDEATNFPAGSTIVIVSCLMTESLARAIQTLDADGHRIVVVSVGYSEPTAIQGIRIEHVSASALFGRRPRRRRYARLVRAVPIT